MNFPLLALAILIVLLFGFTLLTQIVAIRLISRRPPDPADPPDNYGIAFEEVRFAARDKTPLVGWWIPAAVADPTRNAPTIVMCHGQTGSMDGDTKQMIPLHQAGFNVLMFDFRAHGRSGGTQQTMGMYERDDLLGALDYLERTHGIERVGVLGFSMGAAVALITAAVSDRIAAIVADSSFARFKNTLARHLQQAGVPSFRLAWHIAAWALVAAAVKTEGRIDQVDVRLWTPHVRCPTLFIHGGADPLVTMDEVHEMAARCAGPYEVWVVEGAGHGGAFADNPDVYNERVIEWFRKYSDK